MKDRFEEFISENRENFDFREPDPAIWDRLKKDIQPHKKINWMVVVKRAAVVLLIFSASYAVNEFIHRYNSTDLQNQKITSKKMDKALPGLKEAEAYYTTLVNEKLSELKPVMDNCPTLKEELNYDLSGLDSVYVELKKDLKDNMANQEVIEAIIENYRLKISILEDLLKEIEPLKEECLSNTDGYAL